MKKIAKTYSHPLLWALALIIQVSCSSSTEETKTNDEDIQLENLVSLTQAQYDLAQIAIGKAEKRMIGSELKVNGIIDVPPQSNVSINMPYGGFVKFTDILPGSKVKKGQFLISIQNPDFIQFQQEYLENLANREYLKAEYERQSSLYDEKVSSEKTFQLAQSQFLSNEAKLNANLARLQLIGINIDQVVAGKVFSIANIYAPVNGTIRAVYTNVGKYVSPHDVLMDITNADDLHVELSVFEDDIPKIKEGQRIRFSLANSPDNWREAEVFLVGGNVREDRTVTVHGHLKTHPHDIFPGMYVTAKIETGSAEVWSINDDAIVRFGDRHYVFVTTGQSKIGDEVNFQFEMLEVVKGMTEDTFTQITLVDNAFDLSQIKLVTKGAFTLLAKLKNKEEEE